MVCAPGCKVDAMQMKMLSYEPLKAKFSKATEVLGEHFSVKVLISLLCKNIYNKHLNTTIVHLKHILIHVESQSK